MLRFDAGLRSAVPPEALAFAERVVIVPRREIDPGPWSPATAAGQSEQPLGALILGGIVSHQITLAGRGNAALVGPGDVFGPRSVTESILPWTRGGPPPARQ